MSFRFYLITLGIIVVLGGMLYGLDAIPWFRVKDIAVRGSNLVTVSEVRRALISDADRASGILAFLGNDHMLLWLTGGERDVWRAEVKSASVTVYPFRQSVEVEVMERMLKGIFCTEGGACYAFDEEGIVFARAPAAKGQLMLTMSSKGGSASGGRAEEELQKGTQLFSSAEVARFSEIRSTLTDRGAVITDIRLRAAELNEWEVVFADGKTLYFDRGFIPDDFGAMMDALIAREDFEKMNYVDFRVPNKIYFR